MTAPALTPAQRRSHRADAHHLDPVVMIGAEGLTPAVHKEADAALTAHGLIKVRVFSDDRDERQQLFTTLCDALGAASVQHIGKLLVLWRPRPEKERVVHDDRMAAPRVVKVLKFSKSGSHRVQVKKITVLGNQRITTGGTLKKAKTRQISQKKRTLA